MVYNKSTARNCKVTVYGADNKRHMALGVLSEAETGFTLLYSVDGDECCLTYDGSCLIQRRTGGFQTEITFVEGRQTECDISEGGLCGKLPVICERLKVICGKSGVNIKIKYNCGGQEVFLTLTAAKITEKK